MMVSATVQARPQVSFWNDPKARARIVQALLVILLLVLGYEIAVNTVSNLKSRNIASGFGFLARTSGFDINQVLIDYSSASTYGRALVVGFLNTILVSVLSIIMATIIGFVMGVMRLSRN